MSSASLTVQVFRTHSLPRNWPLGEEEFPRVEQAPRQAVAITRPCAVSRLLSGVSSGCDVHERGALGSGRALGIERMLRRQQAAEGEELRYVRFASEGGEHAGEVGG